jgi:transcriptional regulator with XRE-family HTH domain
MRALGRRIRTIRMARGKTQAELARATGVSRREVQNWEAGRRDPRARQADIAAVLSLSERDLLDFSGPIPPPHKPHNYKLGGGGGRG